MYWNEWFYPSAVSHRLESQVTTRGYITNPSMEGIKHKRYCVFLIVLLYIFLFTNNLRFDFSKDLFNLPHKMLLRKLLVLIRTIHCY